MDLQSFLQRACPRVVLPFRFEVHFGTTQIHLKSTQNRTNNGPKSIPERPGDTLAHPWGAVVHLGGLRVAFWHHLGAISGPFGTMWGHLWARLGPFGIIWGPFVSI